MRKILQKGIGSFIALCFVMSCSASPDAYDSGGHPIRLADYAGKWIVVNYWAAWCQPCMQELPELNALYQQHKNHLVVLGVNFDHLDRDTLQQIASQLILTFTILNDFPIERWGVNEIDTIPVTFLLSPKSKLVKTLHGPQTQKSVLQAMDDVA